MHTYAKHPKHNDNDYNNNNFSYNKEYLYKQMLFLLFVIWFFFWFFGFARPEIQFHFNTLKQLDFVVLFIIEEEKIH